MDKPKKVSKKQKTIMLDYELFRKILKEAIKTDRSFSHVLNLRVAAGYEKAKVI